MAFETKRLRCRRRMPGGQPEAKVKYAFHRAHWGHGLSSLLAAVALLAALAAQAAVIYRWVDERGRTHVSDVVPEKYMKSATRIDTGESAVSPERKRQADEAAAREKAFADKAAKRRQGTAPVAAPATVASAPAAKRPTQGVTDSTDCDTWRRLYRESQECFGPYRTTGGATKPEAFDRCNVIPSPDPKCGPLREYPGSR